MVDVNGTKIAFQRSQVALKVASIVCGVISLLLFSVFWAIAFGIMPPEFVEGESSNLVTYIVICGSLGLVSFAINFVVLDYALRRRIKELPALIEAQSEDLVTRFASQLKAHSTVLIVFAWLGVAQAVYGLALYIALPAATSILGGPVEWDIIGILIGLTPSLIHFKLAKTLGYESKILLAQLN
jgi:hypothetical protein